MYASLALVLSELLATFGSLLTTELFVELSPGGVGVAHLIITVIVIQQRWSPVEIDSMPLAKRRRQRCRLQYLPNDPYLGELRKQ